MVKIRKNYFSVRVRMKKTIMKTKIKTSRLVMGFLNNVSEITVTGAKLNIPKRTAPTTAERNGEMAALIIG